ncbi:DegT/DnrJ/EryC1/StrS family aminotransferase [Gammaproteobacteria bacterium]|jgi:CDP-6-deoxy-D-xylo-4-hexulose-3-dehydrase|nr:DegT/DnrJ/EryC1/StrS family aminotransferase [Gammaproteobacteria bacterium]|tara:strand:- start:3853 stop:5043 length:1191 start_codon:yes stop_codon:yes gene_type:complete
MRVYYAEANYGDDEIEAVIKVLKEDRLAIMDGKQVHELEKKVANLFRKDYGLMTNSGSSANLLGVQGLQLPEQSKVITPALTFSTTVAPLVQSNLIPLFIDVELDTLQINTEILKEIPLEGVSAICVPNLIGNIANWEEIYSFAKENNLKIIEDSADTIGYDYQTDLTDWSDVSTTSFYASHVVTGSGFGGMTTFKDKDHFEYAKSLRGWGRRSSRYGETEDYNRRFDCKIGGYDYDDKYVFDDLGYNFMPSEISAAFALVQLDNLENNLQGRANNFKTLADSFSQSSNFEIFKTYENVFTGWLAFPMLLTNKLKGKRKEFQIFLEQAGIQTRTIFTGNILKQPVAKKFSWDSYGTFDVSDEIMQNGIMLGCHNQMNSEKMVYMQQKVFEAEAKIA